MTPTSVDGWCRLPLGLAQGMVPGLTVDGWAWAVAAWLRLCRRRVWQGEVWVALDDRRGTQPLLALQVGAADDMPTLCEAVQRRHASSAECPAVFDSVVLLREGDGGPLPADCCRGAGLVCEFAWCAGRLAVALHFDSRRCRRDEVERLGRYWARLAAAPGESALCTAGEWRRAVVDWNDTDVDLPYEQCLHQLFEQQAQLTPAAPAVVSDGALLSYAELNRRAEALAAHLRSLGVRPGVLVPVMAERSPALVTGLLAVLKAGGAYVPLEPNLPPPQQQMILDDVQATVALAQAPFVAALAQRVAVVVDLDGDAPPPGAVPPVAVSSRDLACVMYTSGSTGRPKGTLIEHRSLANNILWLQRHWPLAAHDRLLQKTPFSFDVSIKEFFWPLACGATLVLAAPGRHVDMAYLCGLIGRHGVTVTHFVPSLLQRFLDLPRAASCRSLRLVMCGAEVLSPRLEQRFFDTLDATLLHLYGPTEAAISVTGFVCERGATPRAAVPLGRPMANVQLYLCDADGAIVPPGLPGEILIGGVAVARGYLKQPQQSAARFVPDRFRPERGAQLYRTGDLARYREDGLIEFLGRADEQLKIRGVRVEPREVELWLQRHPAVDRAFVLPRADRRGELRLVAYLVLLPGAELDPAALYAYCAQRLSGPSVPTMFCPIDSPPLLPHGKVDRQRLPDPDWEAQHAAC